MFRRDTLALAGLLLGASLLLSAAFWGTCIFSAKIMSVLPFALAIAIFLLLALIEGYQKTRRFAGDGGTGELKQALWLRGTGENFGDGTAANQNAAVNRGDAERVVAYADRVIDRQINKTRGILPFNSIIMAALAIERARLPLPATPDPEAWLPIGAFFLIMLALVVSSLLCLNLFLVHRGPSTDYASFKDEFGKTIDLINERSRSIEWATVLSEACLIAGIFLVAMSEASVWVKAPAAFPSRVCAPAAAVEAPAPPLAFTAGDTPRQSPKIPRP